MQNKEANIEKIRIAGVIKESIVDGEGLRYVIFTQGCNHNCLGCQNPDTHDFNGGTEVEINTLLKEIYDNPLIDGVTLSGGDPFFQAEKLIHLVNSLKQHGLDVWAYTGFEFEEFLKFIENKPSDKRINEHMIRLLEYIDVLVDGKFVLEKKTLNKTFVGSTNQRLIDVKQSLKQHKAIEYNLET